MLRRWTLTARLTFLYALVSLMVVLGMAGVSFKAVEHHFLILDQEVLQEKIHLIQSIVAKSASNDELGARLNDALQYHHALYMLVKDAEGNALYSTVTFPIPESTLDRGSVASPTGLTWNDGKHEYRAARATATRKNAPSQPLIIWVAVDTQQHVHFFSNVRKSLFLYVSIASLLSGLLGWWAARSGLAPLRAMKANAQAVTADKLDQRMPVESVPVEMADLAASLNAMLDRLQHDFRRLADFSSDLAHELRTPISALLTQTQVALSKSRDANEYREILISNSEELERLARMISDMLFLAKTEHASALPNPEPIALAEEVQANLDFYEALAEEKRISMHVEGEATIVGDRLMLRRAISNLLSNALRHTSAQGTIRIVLARARETVILSVENSGADINANMLPRLFDRFYRGDPSRTVLDTDGVGLGLAITRAIVEAHRGQVNVDSVNGITRFTLSFPR